MTQFVGLHHRAELYLRKKGIVSQRRYAHAYGMFEEELPLLEYRLRDGSVVREIEQCSPWSSGPVIFYCLEKGGKQISRWSDQEINEYL